MKYMTGRFEIIQSANGKYFFRLIASNGTIILSSESFSTRKEAQEAIQKTRKSTTKIDNIVEKTSSDDYYYFVVVDEDKRIIARSEMYATQAGRENGIYSVIRNSNDADTVLAF